MKKMQTYGFTKWLILLILAVFCLTGAPAYAGPEQEYKQAKEALAQFKQKPQLHKYRDKWLKHIEVFQKFAAKYPKHSKGCDALYQAGMIYSDLSEISHLKRDRRAAAENFEELLTRCPKSSLGDDASYYSAETYVKLGDATRAKNTLVRGIKSYPDGDFQPKMKDLLADLGGSLPAEKKGNTRNEEGSVSKVSANKDTESNTNSAILSTKVTSSESGTRLELAFPSLPTMNHGEIPSKNGSGRRLYFDFKNTQLPPETKRDYRLEDQRVKAIHLNPLDSSTVRVTFDLTDKAGGFGLSTQFAPASTIIEILNGREEDRPSALASEPPILADKKEHKKDDAPPFPMNEGMVEGPGLPVVESAPQSDNAPTVAKAPQYVPNEENTGLKTIVIDPGHGGFDIGARGRQGTQEKDVVLKISMKLKDILEKELGVKVILTRTTDKFIELFDRTKAANEAEADLFISVHANANPRRTYKGVETFYLNNSSDSYSERLAKRENESAGRPISDLDFILTDLAMNANIADSIVLANLVQKSLCFQLQSRYDKVEDRGVRRAVFHVLLHARMPAILAEVSFISNPMEEQRLRKPEYQEEIARGIAAGVKQYQDKMKKLARQP